MPLRRHEYWEVVAVIPSILHGSIILVNEKEDGAAVKAVEILQGCISFIIAQLFEFRQAGWGSYFSTESWELQRKENEDMFKSKTLLITGGTGSFGNAVLRRFLQTDIGEIRIFSRDEKKQDDMRREYKSDKLKFYIGDVRNIRSLKDALYGVDYVFHAAALKQVPSCEFFPVEAVRTNVLGTDNLLTAAIETGVRKVVCLSTDKAAYPINAMGISKAMMEKVVLAKSRTVPENKTLLCCTRYGNVMCSRGSVIPLFIEQIRQGKSLTVTNPHMTRFLMSLEEAVDLVLFAFEHGKTGDLFIQKAPASTIEDLAKAVRGLFDTAGKTPIRIIGTRHGEKLYETLMTTEERVKSEDMGKYFRIPMDERNLNYEKYFSDGNEDLSKVEPYTSSNTEMLDVSQIQKKLKSIEYVRKALEEWDG